ncbi:Hypothetical predicted protein [Mytilus galloprovincialis]|uniref:Integrase zinc-binding domain-containing protein n=1 Tax=Mytilus galloprovincialis TaxID=29158 RepID=A0A8B6HFT6_MYTGA|nr:Hypothetical predicted protein [Mytilus galloprovincialis]
MHATVTYIRQTFWIPTIRQYAKKLLRKCVICRKVNGKAYVAPNPPPLPKIRLQESPPFTVTGVDFTGALLTSNGETSLPIVKLFPLEVSETRSDATSDHTDGQHEDTTQRSTRPKLNAIIKARERIRKWTTNVDENDEED